MTGLEQEALSRCPYCALLDGQCEHEIVRYFFPEGELTDCTLAPDVRQAGRAVVELYQSAPVGAHQP